MSIYVRRPTKTALEGLRGLHCRGPDGGADGSGRMRHGREEGGGGLPPPQHHHKGENDAELGERRGVRVVTERLASPEKMIQARGKKNASKSK